MNSWFQTGRDLECSQSQTDTGAFPIHRRVKDHQITLSVSITIET